MVTINGEQVGVHAEFKLCLVFDVWNKTSNMHKIETRVMKRGSAHRSQHVCIIGKASSSLQRSIDREDDRD